MFFTCMKDKCMAFPFSPAHSWWKMPWFGADWPLKQKTNRKYKLSRAFSSKAKWQFWSLIGSAPQKNLASGALPRRWNLHLGSHTTHKHRTLSWSSLRSFLAPSSTSSSLFICHVKMLNYFVIPRPSKMNFNYIWSHTLIIPLIINQARSMLFTMQLPECSF